MQVQVSRLTKYSLAQLLDVVKSPTVQVLLNKFGIYPTKTFSSLDIVGEINLASDQVLSDLIIEVISTHKSLRCETSPKYRFDERFPILEKSLLLDGYLIEDHSIKALDPNFIDVEPVEDALINELDCSSIQNKDVIIGLIKSSADAFVKAQPDYNASLANIRIALETIVKEIALEKGFNTLSARNTWGGSLSYLKDNKFIDQKDEKALASVFTFISDGAHVPLGFNEKEFVRLGRNLCTSMCYFVIKKYNASKVRRSKFSL